MLCAREGTLTGNVNDLGNGVTRRKGGLETRSGVEGLTCEPEVEPVCTSEAEVLGLLFLPMPLCLILGPAAVSSESEKTELVCCRLRPAEPKKRKRTCFTTHKTSLKRRFKRKRRN
jgi:hypothetical protein